MKENRNDLNVIYNYSDINLNLVLPSKRSLDDVVDELDDTFVECLLRHIDNSDLDDVQVYKKANIDRKLYSKIMSNYEYQPRKEQQSHLQLH